MMTTAKMVFVNAAGKRIGEDHQRATFRNADIDLIFTLRAAGLSMQNIADKFDDLPGGKRVSKSTICRIINGKLYAQIPHRQVVADRRKTAVRKAVDDFLAGPAEPLEFPMVPEV